MPFSTGLPIGGSKDGNSRISLAADTVITSPAPASEEEEAGETEAAESVVTTGKTWQTPIDTLATDPQYMKPLPEKMPLTCKPKFLEQNYWEHGLVHIEKGEFAHQLDSLTATPDSFYICVHPTGMAGDPVPYQFRTDNAVTISLLVCFFLMVWVISRSRHYLKKQLKDFFHTRERDNLFTERTQTEMRGQMFLIFQTCFALSILSFDYTQEYQVEVFNQVSPYRILALSLSVFCLFFLFKIGIYGFVNSIFFTRTQRKLWTESHLMCILGLGIGLLPLALLVVYFDLGIRHAIYLFAAILILDEALLFYKCSRIFFNYTLGWVHLFLYFCTLEVVPVLILYRALIYANNLLLTIN